MTLRSISIDLRLGQTILVGKNKTRARITKIEYHEKSGVISINTTLGPRNVLTFSLSDVEDREETNEGLNTVADKYR